MKNDQIAKEQENTTHNEEQSHSILIDPELAQMLELVADLKTFIIVILQIFKELSRDMEQPEKE